MPVIPEKSSEMEAELAKGKQAAEQSKDGKKVASMEHHQANPGPVITDQNLGEPASKEELQRRAAELNKKD